MVHPVSPWQLRPWLVAREGLQSATSRHLRTSVDGACRLPNVASPL